MLVDMNRWLRLSLQLLSLALFGLLLWWAGPEAWGQVVAGDRAALLAAGLALGGATMAAALRLHLVTTALWPRPVASWPRIYLLTMTARALGLILPRSVSTIGGKSAGLRALGVPLPRSVWIVVVDNLFDLLPLGAILLPAGLYLNGVVHGVGLGLLLGATLLLLAAVLWWMTGRNRATWLLGGLKRFPRLTQKLAAWGVTADNWMPPPGRSLAILGVSFLLNSLLVLSYYFVNRALHLSIPLALIIASYPFVQLSLVVSIAPGGLGLFDLGWLGLLLLGGVSQGQARTFVIAQRAYITIFVLVWTAVSGLLALIEKRVSGRLASVSPASSVESKAAEP